jgi:hypothetical protein
MNSRLVVVRANWDPDAGVWVATSEDMGFAAEAQTVEALRIRCMAIVDDLLEEQRRSGDVEIEFIAHAHDRVTRSKPLDAVV